MTRYLLVHPPLLGPSVWAAVARELGADAHVPDLRACVDPAPGWWHRVVELCRPLLVEDTVLVGHSGAGVVLPAIAAAGPVREIVFADAIVPAEGGVTTPSEGIRSFVASLPSDSHLPRWSDWWDASDLAALVDDPSLLRPILDEQPRLPADFYDHAVPVPAGWGDAVTCRYVQFSAAYDAEVAEATRRGWPVTSLPGTHLHLVEHAADVAGVLRAGS